VIFDSDDLYEGHDRLDLLWRLKEANPAFRMTAFAVTYQCPDDYLEALPDWIEVVPHGFFHGDPPLDGGECAHWGEVQMEALIGVVEHASDRWARGFKAPGWVISDDCYPVLRDHGWWLADQRYNDGRRPAGLRVHCEGDGDHVHTHIQDVCGNGLAETFPALLERVRSARTFELVSESVYPWLPVPVTA
jgi:hypothetical protein